MKDIKEHLEAIKHQWALLKKYAAQVRDNAKEQEDKLQSKIEELLKKERDEK